MSDSYFTEDTESNACLCSNCGVKKPIAEFYRHKGKTSGRHSHCKRCHNLKRREHCAGRVAQGLCIRCGKAAEPGKILCVQHAEINRETTKKNAGRMFETRKSAGLCVRCGSLSRTGLILCEKCSSCKKEKDREIYKKTYHRLKQAGLCVKCKQAARPGRTCCDRHSKESDDPKRRSGHCTECGEVAVPGRKACEFHILQRMLRAKEKERQRSASPEKRKSRREYQRYLRTGGNIHAAIVVRLRDRIRNALRVKTKKSAKTTELIGCSVADLIVHLERQFSKGMSWGNRRLWHVDHIIPCSAFNLTDAKEQKACFHFTNLRPMWAAPNLKKHSKRELLI